jgi:hypothetical protein
VDRPEGLPRIARIHGGRKAVKGGIVTEHLYESEDPFIVDHSASGFRIVAPRLFVELCCIHVFDLLLSGWWMQSS